MDFEPGPFLASMLVSSIGFVLFVFGKKQSRAPYLASGIVLLIYPYFVSNVALMLGIAVAVGGLTWVAVQKGL